MMIRNSFIIMPLKDRQIPASKSAQNTKGFSLLEAIIALSVFLVVVLGAYTSITYAINYNTGNMSRAQALSVLQQEVEQIRSAKFTPQITDSILLGGEKPVRTLTTEDGRVFSSTITVDDDPFTPGIQVATSTATLKHITVTVVLASPSPGWQTAAPATVVIRRVRAN